MAASITTSTNDAVRKPISESGRLGRRPGQGRRLVSGHEGRDGVATDRSRVPGQEDPHGVGGAKGAALRHRGIRYRHVCDAPLSVITNTVLSTVRRSNSVTEPDAVMVRIGEGISLRERGEWPAARDLFAQVWSEIGGESGDPFHRCALAHSMADVQDDVHDELLWDLRALAAADLLTDERAEQGGVAGPVAGFYPSLHLNLADCYRKLGELDRAREHLDHGRASVNILGNDSYAQMIKGGLERLADKLG